MKKLFYFLTLALTAVFFQACTSSSSVVHTITVDKETMQLFFSGLKLDSDGGTQKISFTAADEWSTQVENTTKSVDWITVTPAF